MHLNVTHIQSCRHMSFARTYGVYNSIIHCFSNTFKGRVFNTQRKHEMRERKKEWTEDVEKRKKMLNAALLILYTLHIQQSP